MLSSENCNLSAGRFHDATQPWRGPRFRYEPSLLYSHLFDLEELETALRSGQRHFRQASRHEQEISVFFKNTSEEANGG